MEETTPSPEYLKGFNEGYIIARENPDLAEKISKAKGDTERLLGFQDGLKEYSLEKLKQLRPKRDSKSSKESDMNKSKSNDRDFEME